MANQLSEARETASMLGLEMPAPHEAERRPSVRSPLRSAVPRGVRLGLGESHGKRLQDVGWIIIYFYRSIFESILGGRYRGVAHYWTHLVKS